MPECAETEEIDIEENIDEESHEDDQGDEDQDERELSQLSEGDKALHLKLRDLERHFEEYSCAPINLAKLEFKTKSEPTGTVAGTHSSPEPSHTDSISLKLNDVMNLLISTAVSSRQLHYKIAGLKALTAELESSMYSLQELEIQRTNLVVIVKHELNRTLASVLTERGFQGLQDQTFTGVRRVHIAAALPSERIIPPVAKSVMILVAIIHCTMGVSRNNCTLILRSIQAILKMVLRLQNPHVLDSSIPFIADIPITLPTVLHHLGLDEHLDTYVACPACHTLYKENDSSIMIPDTCSTADLDGTVCGAQLYASRHRGNRAWQQPYRHFSHQTLEAWLTRILNRPGIENLIKSTAPVLQGRCTDVWGASYMSTIPGVNMSSFFGSDTPAGELRLAFILYHDFYNPFGNRQGGKKQSVGMIMMACLNLPPDLCYNIENIYMAGMIPGPKEPAQDRINNYLQPVVINLEEHFSMGVIITRTHSYPRGRKVRSVAPLSSMDIVASRGAAGIVGATFQPRSMDKHHIHVQEWLLASGLVEREASWKKNAAQYSELLCLPYWNAFTSTLVAPMHWTKNVLEKQIRDNMGSSVTVPSGIPALPPLSRDISQNELNWGLLAMDHLSAGELLKAGLTEPLARYLCRKRGIFEAGLHSKALLKKLNGWRMDNFLLKTDGTLLDPDINRVLTVKTFYYLEKAVLAKEKNKVSPLNSHSTLDSVWQLCSTLSVSWNERDNKSDLIDKLMGHYDVRNVEWVNTVEANQDHFSILGKEVVAEVKLDMRSTKLPEWLKKPLVNFATTKHGRIGAEEYKSLSIVSLPITLIRLWGHPHSQPELRRILDHFLHLSLSVRILAYQLLTAHDIRLFEYHYQEYLNGLKTLYPSCSITLVQHLGMHIPYFLETLGPSTRYSENMAEMFIGILQKLPTNFKIGELEQTLHRTLIMASNLRALLRTSQSSKALEEFSNIISAYLNTKVPIIDHQILGVWQTVHDNTPMHLDSTTYHALSAWATENFIRPFTRNLWLCSMLRRGNVEYQPYTVGLGNSSVLFRPRGQDPVLTRGRIECILQEPEAALPILAAPRVVLIVRAFSALSQEDKPWDPYANHPLVGQHRFGIMSLYYNRVETHTAHIIEPNDIMAHVTVTTYNDPTGQLSEQCIVITDLDLKYVHQC